MARSLSLAMKQALFAQETGETILFLLTISHAQLAQPIRIVQNNENIVSNGNTFTAFPFDISVPDDRDDELSQITCRIDNVDRQLMEAARTITSAADVTFSIILASEPNTLAFSQDFKMQEVTVDEQVVTGVLTRAPLADEPFPGYNFVPSKFPGLF